MNTRLDSRQLALCLVLFNIIAWPAFATGQGDDGTCYGKQPTIIGTEDADVLIGTRGRDIILALGGNDIIYGGKGPDLICAGDGDDDIKGGKGFDVIDAGLGHDLIDGGKSFDICDGGIGIDTPTKCEFKFNVNLTVGQVSLLTPDGRTLDGALFVPDAYTTKVAVLTTHGATGNFTSAIALDAGFYFEPYHMTVLSLNRRDNGLDEGGRNTLFPDAACDLKVGVDFLESLGYQKVFIMGHSKGTTMASIYPSLFPNCAGADPSATRDPRVVATGTYGTIADSREAAQFALFPEPLYSQHVATANLLVNQGLGDIPFPFETAFGFPLVRTPNSWLSFNGPDTLSVPEREVVKLEIPLLLVHNDGDNFTPKPWSERVLAAALAGGVDATLINQPYPFPDPFPGPLAHSFSMVQTETIWQTWFWLAQRVPAVLFPARNIDIPDLPEFDPPLRPNP